MNLFRAQGRLARRHPAVALVAIAILTAVLAVGITMTEQSSDQSEAFLPEDNEVVRAQQVIADTFAGGAAGSTVQVIVRGNVLEPEAVQGVLDAMTEVAQHPDVAPLLGGGQRAVFSYAHSLDLVLQDRTPDQVDREEIDAAIEQVQQLEGAEGQLGRLADSLDRLLARDQHGDPIGGLGTVVLTDASDDEIAAASLAAEQVVASAEIPGVDARTFSPAKLSEEINESQSSTTALLMGLAFLVILVLLVIFYRSLSDVVLSMAGLVVIVTWIFGLQGLLGPGGLGLLGPSNPTVIMIPVLLIGLVVDFALQLTNRYREGLAEDQGVGEAAYSSVRHTGLPILLAAVTTAISFLTNVFQPLPPLRDFGIVAGIGVVAGYVVMATVVPAGRVVLDRRRARKQKHIQQRSLADTIPGAGRALAAVAGVVMRRPVPILVVVAAVGIAAGFTAVRIDTTFSTTDFLPSDTESAEDLRFLERNFGGGTASVTLLVEGQLDDRLVRDVVGIESALETSDRRPDLASGAPTRSVLSLIDDLTQDSGLPGDPYSPEFARYMEEVDLDLTVESAQFREIFDRLRQAAPDAVDRVLAVEDDGLTRSIIEVPTSSGSHSEIQDLVNGLEHLWEGEPGQLTVTGQDVLEVSVTEELVSSQSRSILLTVVAALVVLSLYFGIAHLRPVLGLLAVLPIGLAVVLVLATMVLFDISYNVFTAMITALTIGVGVDYTVHVSHRFIEELEQSDGNVTAAMAEAMHTTGAALVASALSTALGFAVLVFSPLTPMRQFGILTAITIIYSLLAAFLVLPPMLRLWTGYHRWRSTRAAPGDSLRETVA